MKKLLLFLTIFLCCSWLQAMEHPKDDSLYKMLELDCGAKQEDIKHNYRKLSIKLHPDRNPSFEATEHYKKITNAFAILSNPEAKKVYDQSGLAAAQNLLFNQGMMQHVREEVYRVKEEYQKIFRNVFDTPDIHTQPYEIYDQAKNFYVEKIRSSNDEFLKNDLKETILNNCYYLASRLYNAAQESQQPNCRQDFLIKAIKYIEDFLLLGFFTSQDTQVNQFLDLKKQCQNLLHPNIEQKAHNNTTGNASFTPQQQWPLEEVEALIRQKDQKLSEYIRLKLQPQQFKNAIYTLYSSMPDVLSHIKSKKNHYQMLEEKIGKQLYDALTALLHSGRINPHWRQETLQIASDMLLWAEKTFPNNGCHALFFNLTREIARQKKMNPTNPHTQPVNNNNNSAKQNEKQQPSAFGSIKDPYVVSELQRREASMHFLFQQGNLNAIKQELEGIHYVIMRAINTSNDAMEKKELYNRLGRFNARFILFLNSKKIVPVEIYRYIACALEYLAPEDPLVSQIINLQNKYSQEKRYVQINFGTTHIISVNMPLPFKITWLKHKVALEKLVNTRDFAQLPHVFTAAYNFLSQEEINTPILREKEFIKLVLAWLCIQCADVSKYVDLSHAARYADFALRRLSCNFDLLADTAYQAKIYVDTVQNSIKELAATQQQATGKKRAFEMPQHNQNDAVKKARVDDTAKQQQNAEENQQKSTSLFDATVAAVTVKNQHIIDYMKSYRDSAPDPEQFYHYCMKESKQNIEFLMAKLKEIKDYPRQISYNLKKHMLATLYSAALFLYENYDSSEKKHVALRRAANLCFYVKSNPLIIEKLPAFTVLEENIQKKRKRGADQ